MGKCFDPFQIPHLSNLVLICLWFLKGSVPAPICKSSHFFSPRKSSLVSRLLSIFSLRKHVQNDLTFWHASFLQNASLKASAQTVSGVCKVLGLLVSLFFDSILIWKSSRTALAFEAGPPSGAVAASS